MSLQFHYMKLRFDFMIIIPSLFERVNQFSNIRTVVPYNETTYLSRSTYPNRFDISLHVRANSSRTGLPSSSYT